MQVGLGWVEAVERVNEIEGVHWEAEAGLDAGRGIKEAISRYL